MSSTGRGARARTGRNGCRIQALVSLVERRSHASDERQPAPAARGGARSEVRAHAVAAAPRPACARFTTQRPQSSGCVRVRRRRPAAAASSARTSDRRVGRGGDPHAPAGSPPAPRRPAPAAASCTRASEVMSRNRSSPPSAAKRRYCSGRQYTSIRASSGAPMAPVSRSFSSSRVTSVRSSMKASQSMAPRLRLGQRVPGDVEHRCGALPRQMTPHLLRGERQDGREPAHHALGDVPHRGLRRTARAAVGRAWCTDGPSACRDRSRRDPRCRSCGPSDR